MQRTGRRDARPCARNKQTHLFLSFLSFLIVLLRFIWCFVQGDHVGSPLRPHPRPPPQTPSGFREGEPDLSDVCNVLDVGTHGRAPEINRHICSYRFYRFLSFYCVLYGVSYRATTWGRPYGPLPGLSPRPPPQTPSGFREGEPDLSDVCNVLDVGTHGRAPEINRHICSYRFYRFLSFYCVLYGVSYRATTWGRPYGPLPKPLRALGRGSQIYQMYATY